jgi:organic hydroperoxide reductase OsmC/OhrA
MTGCAMAWNVLLRRFMPVPFPHHYQTWLVRTLSSRARLEAPPRPMIAGGPVPEMDGDATSWSSEHMLLSSIGLCLLTTFEAFAARDRIDLVSWEAHVGGTVDKGAKGLEFTRFTVQVDMEVSDPERARATLDEAKQHCLITNALRVPVEIDARIRPPAVRKAG